MQALKVVKGFSWFNQDQDGGAGWGGGAGFSERRPLQVKVLYVVDERRVLEEPNTYSAHHFS